jgi:hypothetical protein
LGVKIVSLFLRRLFWVIPAIVLAAGCGKKGPPLAPILRIPAPIDMIQAQRSGRDVFVTLTVPATNIDSSIPVDLGRIEVYGYTGRVPPPRARWAELGELVTTFPVVLPPQDASASAAATAESVDGAPLGASPGTMVTVLDTLTPEELVQGRVGEALPVRRGREPLTPVVTATEPAGLRRFYVAFGFSVRGRPGPPGAAAEFPLVELPEPPAFVQTSYTESVVVVEWPPSGGFLGSLFDHPLGPEDVPLDEALEPIVTAPPVATGASVAESPSSVPVPPGPVRYNVYRELAPDPLAPPDQTRPAPWSAMQPTPINPVPLDVMTFTDPVELDRGRCYVVRPIRGTTPNVIEGDASAPACVTPTDIFPPAAPTRLVAVTDEGGISLIWEPNGEPDLDGYLVLRGEATDATLQPLTPAPIAEPRFRDTHVTAGKKYVYAVVAVDAPLPVPTISAESNRVEETAR